MRDKTQFDPPGLTVKYASLTMVVLGTTLGMMTANVPAALLGKRLARYMPLFKIRFNAATFLAAFVLLILLKVPFGLGLQ